MNSVLNEIVDKLLFLSDDELFALSLVVASYLDGSDFALYQYLE